MCKLTSLKRWLSHLKILADLADLEASTQVRLTSACNSNSKESDALCGLGGASTYVAQSQINTPPQDRVSLDMCINLCKNQLCLPLIPAPRKQRTADLSESGTVRAVIVRSCPQTNQTKPETTKKVNPTTLKTEVGGPL